MAKIVAFAGSARIDSWNKKLVRCAADAVAAAGAEVTVLDLRDFPMPLYDGDLEAADGLPEHAARLKKIVAAHDGYLLACPEYNGSITPLLKNTIDWISRPAPDEAPMAAFRGKTAALLSASPGGFGGMRGLVHVRAILGGIGVLVLPDQVAVPKAHEAFADDGSLRDERVAKRVASLAEKLAATVSRLA
jgi:NAD(P)H-dependent FMN reductase